MSGLLYASGGRGLLRYFFLHGSHERTTFPDQVEVEANVVSFARDGKMYASLPIHHTSPLPPRV